MPFNEAQLHAQTLTPNFGTCLFRRPPFFSAVWSCHACNYSFLKGVFFFSSLVLTCGWNMIKTDYILFLITISVWKTHWHFKNILWPFLLTELVCGKIVCLVRKGSQRVFINLHSQAVPQPPPCTLLILITWENVFQKIKSCALIFLCITNFSISFS